MSKTTSTENQLILDSSAALSAGISYGYYIASLNRPVPPRKPTEPEPNAVCRYCGAKFYDKFNRGRLYCSYECGKKYLYRKQKGLLKL